MTAPKKARILMVDDEAATLDSFELTLAAAGFDSVVRCLDSRRALEQLHALAADVVLLDLSMPYVSGEELLEVIRNEHPDTEVIVITGIDTTDSAVRCMRMGAYDYLVKPVDESRLTATVGRAMETILLRQENICLRERFLEGRILNPQAFEPIVTASDRMRHIFQYVEAIGASRQPVLITGETGVGKELLARAIHAISRPGGPFVAVNVAGLDDIVFSDTLFGHSKGAFTGAHSIRPGLVEKAAGGSLFLDEIGDLSHTSQVKLLRLIQEREYMSLGSDSARPAEIRILAATHCDIEDAVAEGRFRKDLYFRLNTHRIHIPPLRERLEDIPPLLNHFMHKAAKELGREAPCLPKGLPRRLSAYSFPGNVRELEGLVFDALSRSGSQSLDIQPFRDRLGMSRLLSDEPDIGTSTGGSILFPEKLPTLAESNELLIAEAMRRAEGKQILACRMLGLSQPALSKRLKRSKLKF
jgi:DNA-binding NtrC family response regulator